MRQPFFWRELRGVEKLKTTPSIALYATDTITPEAAVLGDSIDGSIATPFLMSIFLSEIESVLERTRHRKDVVTCGDLRIDKMAYRVWRGGRLVKVTGLAYSLLCFLAENPDRVHSREDLRFAVWGEKSKIDLRTVDVHIGLLRKGILQHDDIYPVRTVHKAGYSLESRKL